MTAMASPRDVMRKFRSRRHSEAMREQQKAAARYEYAIRGQRTKTEQLAVYRKMTADLPREQVPDVDR